MAKKTTATDLEQRLVKIERALGLSKLEVCGLLGMSHPQLWRWRSGVREPNFSELQREILARLESSSALIEESAARRCLSVLKNRGRLQFLEQLLTETA